MGAHARPGIYSRASPETRPHALLDAALVAPTVHPDLVPGRSVSSNPDRGQISRDANSRADASHMRAAACKKRLKRSEPVSATKNSPRRRRLPGLWET